MRKVQVLLGSLVSSGLVTCLVMGAGDSPTATSDAATTQPKPAAAAKPETRPGWRSVRPKTAGDAVERDGVGQSILDGVTPPVKATTPKASAPAAEKLFGAPAMPRISSSKPDAKFGDTVKPAPVAAGDAGAQATAPAETKPSTAESKPAADPKTAPTAKPSVDPQPSAPAAAGSDVAPPPPSEAPTVIKSTPKSENNEKPATPPGAATDELEWTKPDFDLGPPPVLTKPKVPKSEPKSGDSKSDEASTGEPKTLTSEPDSVEPAPLQAEPAPRTAAKSPSRPEIKPQPEMIEPAPIAEPGDETIEPAPLEPLPAETNPKPKVETIEPAPLHPSEDQGSTDGAGDSSRRGRKKPPAATSKTPAAAPKTVEPKTVEPEADPAPAEERTTEEKDPKETSKTPREAMTPGVRTAPDLIRPEDSAKPIYELKPDAQAEPAPKPAPQMETESPEPSAEKPPAIKLTREVKQLQADMEAVLDHYRHRRLNSRDHNHWEVMHQIVCWGVKAEIELGGPRGEPVNAIAYQCYNNLCRGEEFMYVDRIGIEVKKGPRVQGHYGQFLAILAQSGVSLDYPMKVRGKQFTVADLVESEKKGCEPNMELTFKLLALSYYLEDSDEIWTSATGQPWNIERLIRAEIAAPILNDAACGGTHRLMGLTYAIRRRIAEGKPLNGQFARAAKYINDYQLYTLGLQNPDGSFSTEWFRGKAAKQDVDRRLQTTGHILEWLVYSLHPEDLTDPRVVKAARYLTNLLASQPNKGWEIGPMGHALHALMLYNRRLKQAAGTASEVDVTALWPSVD